MEKGYQKMERKSYLASFERDKIERPRFIEKLWKMVTNSLNCLKTSLRGENRAVTMNNILGDTKKIISF